MQGFVQLIIWGKIASSINQVLDIGDPYDTIERFNQSTTSQFVVQDLNSSIQEFFASYPPKTQAVTDAITEALANVTKIPDEFWPAFLNYTYNEDADSPLPSVVDNFLPPLYNALRAIVLTLSNVIFSAFGIDFQGEVSAKESDNGTRITKSALQLDVSDQNWERYALVVSLFTCSQHVIYEHVY